METTRVEPVDAHKLRSLLEKRHGDQAIHWCDQFALGCWLYHTGQERAGRKIVNEVLSTVRARGNQSYLDAVSDEAARAPAPLAISVWPHQELVALFESADIEERQDESI
ncbi:hypothetical protein [Burkholderia multivorans]|uniref:hypothetical protein n=1 Tax=Burkholderia multivorans TaxID=87883 RepID=UPI000752B91D|nr:hypothetical protein [Burkholderia multivorans]KVS16149.1 hypothetical protein WK33_06345 [Burkholderia multivorans]MBU9651079.1 hypothetical protein [Burkholderia multivorans]MCO1451086.1 hypothetical protein [Burkholderia multivorans]MDN8103991.1 hypothetical protein [Burkholderia multivorans]PRG70400.1 hypothetical protein C6T69_15115 [Burkholderia multivorans]